MTYEQLEMLVRMTYASEILALEIIYSKKYGIPEEYKQGVSFDFLFFTGLPLWLRAGDCLL